MCKSESESDEQGFIVATSQGNITFTLGLTVKFQRQSNSKGTFPSLRHKLPFRFGQAVLKPVSRQKYQIII